MFSLLFCTVLILGTFSSLAYSGSQNVARGKTTTQSSTTWSGYSTYAVDGNRNSVYFDRSCTHTSHSSSPWWRVDLGKEYTVSYLRITNRVASCCYKRLSDFEIRIGNSLADNGNLNPKCGGLYSLGKGETRRITCPALMNGRYVNIVIPGAKKCLTLCEVEVYAISEPLQPVSVNQNVARGKTTTQSSTAWRGYSTYAVDGNRNSVYSGHSCTHTSLSSSPWWRVDLGKEYNVSYLRITNRVASCCYKRLSDFEIRIGNSLADNGNLNPKCGGLYSLGKGETRRITCPALMNGRYVNIVIPGAEKCLTLCEVEVYTIKETLRGPGACVKADWSFSFNMQGWSTCPETNPLIIGLERKTASHHRRDHIYHIEGAGCCSVPGEEYECLTQDWSANITGYRTWNLCPSGYFLSGLYRQSGHQLRDIVHAKCCKPKNRPTAYKTCYNEDVTHIFNSNDEGLKRCQKVGYYMTGLYKSVCEYVYCIEAFKCCSLAEPKKAPPCTSSPCLNGGICVNHKESFICGCTENFGGKRCELDIGCAKHTFF